MTFDQALAFVLEEEGGVANDAADAGGLTKFGISSREYPEVRLSTFSREQAIAIYKRDFWDRLKCDNLPWPVALVLFDTAVQHGSTNASRWLQQALNVKADGIIGDITTRAAWATSLAALEDLLSARAFWYAGCGGFLHFGRGWMRRLFRLHSEIEKGFA